MLGITERKGSYEKSKNSDVDIRCIYCACIHRFSCRQLVFSYLWGHCWRYYFFWNHAYYCRARKKDQAEQEAKELIRKQIAIDNLDKKRWEQGNPTSLYLSPGHYQDNNRWISGQADYIGRWDIHGSLKNISPYVINYVHAYIYPADRIGSKVHDTTVLTFTGPLQPKQAVVLSDKDKWYKLSVDKVVIEKIAVEYQGGGTQVTSVPVYVSAHHGNGNSSESWVYGKPAADGSWGVISTVRYHGEKDASKIVFYIVPLDSTGIPLDAPAQLSYRSTIQSKTVSTVWWTGIWKGKPVARVKLKKYIIEYTDGTTQTVEF